MSRRPRNPLGTCPETRAATCRPTPRDGHSGRTYRSPSTVSVERCKRCRGTKVGGPLDLPVAPHGHHGEPRDHERRPSGEVSPEGHEPPTSRASSPNATGSMSCPGVEVDVLEPHLTKLGQALRVNAIHEDVKFTRAIAKVVRAELDVLAEWLGLAVS